MWYQYFHNLAIYLHQHPHLAGIITFFVALTESLAIIGAIVPGSVTMTAIGALIGSGALPMAGTILWAIGGAFVGDFISYGAGIYYNERLRKIWPFTRYPNLFIAGEAFFRKHGGKSILIGRFAGPARSVVPLIAGLMHLSVFRFIFAAIPSAALWAITYIVPGILVGALSLELPPSTATKFIVAILIIIMLSWLLFWFVHFFFKTIANCIDYLVVKSWNYFKSHRSLHWITTLLNDPRYPEHHQQLTLALFTLITGVLFLILYGGVITHAAFFHINEPLHAILRSLRNRVCDDIMILFTILGDKKTLLTAGVLILIWLAVKKYWWAASHWLAIMIISSSAAEFFKRSYFNARPDGLLITPSGSSFPSGHTTLSLALFSFLATLIARELKPEHRKIPYIIAAILVFFIGLSRLYLGAHWFTDVLGAVLLGFTCFLIITLSYRRKPTPHISPKSFSAVTVTILLLTCLGFSFATFHKTRNDYTLYWPSLTIDSSSWWEQQSEARQIPLYVISRLGKPHQALNVEWLGSLAEIKAMLIAQGWQDHNSRLNLKGSLNQFSKNSTKEIQAPHQLPLLPTLYHNQAPVLLMTKMINNRQIIFQLWQSNIYLYDLHQKLWLGNISYYIPRTKNNKNDEDKKKSFISATETFKPFIRKYAWKIVAIPPDEQPSLMSKLNWDGKLLLIKSH